MTDLRFYATVPATAQADWEAFATDKGWLTTLTLSFGKQIIVPASGVLIKDFIDTSGRHRFNVRLYGAMETADELPERDHPTKVDEKGNPKRIKGSAVRDEFKAGTKSSITIERKRSDDTVYASGSVVTGQKVGTNIVLIGDQDDGEVPNDLREYVWAGTPLS